MFLFKKVVAQFFFPIPLILLISLAGLLLLWFTNKQKVGKILVSAGICILALLSYEPIPNALLSPLESRYNPYGYRNNDEDSRPECPHPVKFVVVLGGGHTSDPSMPIASQIHSS